MVTGYFLLSGHFAFGGDNPSLGPPAFKNAGTSPIVNFVRKTGLIYAGATLLYLPVSIYAGHFSEGSILAVIARNIVFDGTFYHLWYLPASIIGVLIIYGLGRKFSRHVVLGISLALYVTGLLGDSYFGVIYHVPFLMGAYESAFHVFSYTRNGLFYAPVFLMLGAMAAGQRSKMPSSETPSDKVHPKYQNLRLCGFGLLFFMGLLIFEGLLLNHFSLQRHTSMYIALVPCMYFLFRLLIISGGKSSPLLRSISLWIFIIHPLVIISVRGAARFVGLTELIVGNSIVHFATVSLLSAILSIALSKLWLRYKKKPSSFKTGRAWIELNMDNLRHNVQVLKYHLPHDCQLMPAIKANAYGHGAIEISKELNASGIRAFCVATVLEGAELREGGIKGEILILGYTHPDHFHLLKKHRLTQTVIDFSYAEALSNYGKKLMVHIAVDTGMRRLGEDSDNIENIIKILSCKNLIISGIYSHLCTVDGCAPSDAQFAEKQISCFNTMLSKIKEQGFIPPRAHIQSSYGVFRYPELSYDYARVGIAIYGMLSSLHDDEKYKTGLRPVLSLKARISAVKDMCEGESAGYGLAFTAARPTKIAMLAIGYADGVPRGLSCGVGAVLVKGKRAPIIGRICMDQMMIDVTGIDGARQGDEVVIIGDLEDEKITACEIAGQTGTIANEVLSRLGRRLERYVN